MRGFDLLNKMELAAPEFVEAAGKARAKKSRPSAYWGVLAACLALAVFAGSRAFLAKVPPGSDGLPLLTLSEDTEAAMGFEGYMAYDISELVDSNPWNPESAINHLPVFRNLLSGSGQAVSEDAMRAFLLEVAGRAGLEEGEYTISDNSPDAETREAITQKFASVGEAVPEDYFAPTALILKSEDITIEVDQTLTATLTFTPALTLPDELNFSYHASYQDICRVGEYLAGAYRGLIGFEAPVMNIRGGDYNIYREQSYWVEFYEGIGSEEEKLLHYNFDRVSFYCDDEGKLWLARVYAPDLTQKVGDYPIITPEKARALLLEGKYITTVPYAFAGAGSIAKTELIYRSARTDEYFIPYYRIYAEIPELEENGMKTYGAYYVPAVEERYISNMPLWDGNFN